MDNISWIFVGFILVTMIIIWVVYLVQKWINKEGKEKEGSYR